METISSHSDNIYWFLRYLVASKFGSYARRETKNLEDISDYLSEQVQGLDKDASDEEIEDVFSEVEGMFLDSISRRYGGDISKRYKQAEDMVERIEKRIESPEDFLDLKMGIDIVLETTEVQNSNETFGEDEVHEIIDDTLETEEGDLDPSKAYEGLFNVDVEGEEFQLTAQRTGLADLANRISERLEERNEIEGEEILATVTAVAQEYERRAGQSRSSTAGNVLEEGLQRIFDRFNIPATGSPEHQGDLELDNKVEGENGIVGFSCKRSLRERFRQSLTRNAEVDVDEIWFVALMMSDISKDKIKDIKNDGSRLYVPRDSFIWEEYGDDEELEEGLYPADQFLYDLSEFTGHELDT